MHTHLTNTACGLGIAAKHTGGDVRVLLDVHLVLEAYVPGHEVRHDAVR
jgi:hypothetical protein